jgi:hypothetical protein
MTGADGGDVSSRRETNHQGKRETGSVMLNTAFAEIAGSGIDRVPDAVLFVAVDADEGGGFGDYGWW